MINNIDLSNKVAVITGGNKGIGFAAAQVLAKHGAKIVLVGRDQKALQRAKEAISPECLAISCDISKLEEIDLMFRKVHEVFGGIDILFMNAGVSQRFSLEEATEEAFDRLCNTNFKGTFFTLQKGLKYLNQKASVIVNASVQGMLCVVSNHSIYACTKAALIQLARSAAGDLSAQHIRVNAISPMWVKTDPWDQNLPLVDQLSKEVPLERRFTTPEEVANVVLFLASHLSNHMTGQNLVIDGGVSMVLQHPEIKEL